MSHPKGKYASGREAVAQVLNQDEDRVFVVTILEEPTGLNSATITRCQFAHGAAHDFLAWIVSKGKTASLRVMAEMPHRGSAELARAMDYVSEFVHREA